MIKHILITRPVIDSLTLESEIKALGYQPFVEPTLSIQNINFKFPDISNYQALVFTSANAVRAAEDILSAWPDDKPVYALSPHTDFILDNQNVVDQAIAAKNKKGQRGKRHSEEDRKECVEFDEVPKRIKAFTVKAVEGGGEALMSVLQDDLGAGRLLSEQPLLHVCGEDIARPLNVSGLSIECLPVYKAQKADILTEECLELIDRQAFESVLFFSTRTAEAFITLVKKYGRTESFFSTKALCLADSMLNSVREINWKDVQVAKQPDRRNLLALLKQEQRRYDSHEKRRQ